MLVSSAQAQQIASVDLSHLQKQAAPGRKQEKTVIPKGCEKLIPGAMADGIVSPRDDEPREIEVEMVKLSNENPVIGSEVQGEVQFRNSGKYPKQIPWSTEPKRIEKGQNPNHLSWEEANFKIVLKGSELLENLSQPLLGARISAGSELTIQPGEWVTVTVKFKLAPQYPIPGRSIRKGKRELLVRWDQAARSWGIKNCAVTTGWFDYRNYYRQKNPTVTINVN
jgi:hypothetical protein